MFCPKAKERGLWDNYNATGTKLHLDEPSAYIVLAY